MKRISQTKRALRYLSKGKSITKKEARHRLNIPNMDQTARNLREQGYPVVLVRNTQRRGRRVPVYVLGTPESASRYVTFKAA